MENSKKTNPIPGGQGTSKETETQLIKSRHVGWKAETTIKQVNGYDWQISTSKGQDGIRSTALAGSYEAGNNGFSSFKWVMFEDPCVVLHTSSKRGTEKAIKEAHQIGLLKFDELRESSQLPGKSSPEYEIKEGQLIFFDGPNGREINAIYHILKERGTLYQYVNLKTLQLGETEYLRNVTDKFGIGFYFQEGEMMELEKLNEIVIEAKARLAEKLRKKNAEKILDEAVRAAKMEEGQKLVKVPSWAKAVIVAHLKKDTSYPQSDYFHHQHEKTIYLAFSAHKRDLFPEMRKACLNADEVKQLAEAPKKWEHREKSGYYISEHRHSGWEVRKGSLNPQNPKNLEKLCIAAAEGRYFCQPEIAPEESSLTIQGGLIEYNETVHAKKGHKLYVVSLTERLERDTFLQLKSLAKRHEGYYSSYNRDGAIPGFQFTSKENAKNFRKIIETE